VRLSWLSLRDRWVGGIDAPTILAPLAEDRIPEVLSRHGASATVRGGMANEARDYGFLGFDRTVAGLKMGAQCEPEPWSITEAGCPSMGGQKGSQ